MPKAWNKNNQLSRERLLELLDYDQTSGVFRWRVDRNSYGGKVKVGSIAGRLDKYGYRYIGIDGGICQAHVLAWVYVYKKWPDVQIDHKNMVQDDNRIENLREASMTMQRANQRVRRDSSTGVKGVSKTPEGKYKAKIRKDGVSYHIGHYDTVADASVAYQRMAVKLFGEFARI